jgi:hypothetical protein
MRDLKKFISGMDWVWEKWIQSGVLNGLCSKPGDGKTRFFCDLARRIWYGLEFPDGSPPKFPKSTPTLWVCSDKHQAELYDLRNSFGIPEDGLFLNASPHDPFSGTRLDTGEELRNFEARIEKIRPGLVFIDTILYASSSGWYNPEDASGFLSPLQEIAARQKVAILGSTHLNSQGEAIGKRIDGLVRSMMKLTCPDKEGQPNRRKIEILKTNSRFPPPLGVTMLDWGNEYDTDPPVSPEDDPVGGGSRYRPSPELEKAIEWLGEQVRTGPRTVASLRKEWEAKDKSASLLYKAKQALKLHETEEKPKRWCKSPDEALFEFND